jgi:hypothetical protein
MIKNINGIFTMMLGTGIKMTYLTPNERKFWMSGFVIGLNVMLIIMLVMLQIAH